MSRSNYRQRVGPPALYDVIGAQQFMVLVGVGLRDDHYLLEIGCGSLRAGRFFIPYLKKGHYFGVEPDQGLVSDGILNELGQDAMKVKAPTFDPEPDFRLTKFGRSFDYLLAQSIFTHAPVRQVTRCLMEAMAVLPEGGMFVFTYKPGPSAYAGDEWTNGVAVYPPEKMKGWVERAGFSFRHIRWPHPNGLTWAMASKGQLVVRDTRVVPVEVRRLLFGGSEGDGGTDNHV